MQRYFVNKVDDKFVLSSSDFHHIKNVMRITSTDKFICVYDYKCFLCTIQYLANSYKINVIKEVTEDVELKKKVILYQAVIKNDKFDLVIQKATELGVSEIIPTIFSRSVVKVDSENEEKKLMRYQKIAKEACEQSHRNIIPNILNYQNVKKINLDDKTLGLLAYEGNGDVYSLSKELKNIKDYEQIAIIIGPEGGYSTDEVDYLLKMGFKNVSLGRRILRAETAAICALSIVAYQIEGNDNEL